MENKTLNTWNEVVSISKACNHRFKFDSGVKISHFAEGMLRQISHIEHKVPAIDLSSERNYFLRLLKI